MNWFIKIRNLVLDILFPKVCINCRKYLSAESEKSAIICEPCTANIAIYKVYSENPALAVSSDGFILGAAASYENKAVRELVYALKYKRLAEAAKPLAELMIEHVELSGMAEIIIPSEAIIIPIPLYAGRLRKRGYNQSELIANIIGKHFGIHVKTDILKRIKNTSPQIEMKTTEKRAENIKGSFEANKEKSMKEINGKQIILVDDIFTSGATIKEAVKILKKLKPEKIIVLVTARAGY